MPSAKPPVPEVPGNNQDPSIVSNLTEDGGGGPSVVGRVRSGISSIVIQSWAIMTGGESSNSNSNLAITMEEDENMGISDGNVVLFPKKQTEEEEEIPPVHVTEPVICFLEDDTKDMTWGRRIALANVNRTWYNPQQHMHKTTTIISTTTEDNNKCDVPKIETRPPTVTKQETASIAKAWAYFDHVVLPRHLMDEDGITFKRHDLKRAEPGESEYKSRLYHPLCTPLSQMGDFGLGVGLYFSSLRALMILTLVAGILNIPNFIYFSGPDYSDSQEGLPDLLKGSAICTVQEWVPCEDCMPQNFMTNKFATSTGASTNLTFALNNNCAEVTLQQGMINYGTLLLVVVGILIMNRSQKRMEVAFDEDEQTAQDYSIQIQNPPDNATDPKEWRKYFKDVHGAHATVVTIALANDPLIIALRERRECIRKIELNLEPGTSLDTLTLARMSAEVEFKRGLFGRLLATFVKGLPEVFGRMAELEAKIKGWAQLEYPCSNVFVTFETEKEQRKVLSALMCGSYHTKHQNTAVLDYAKFLFRGDLVLKLAEPDEPNTIRWADLNVRMWDMLKPLATTTFFSLLSILLIALLIKAIQGSSPQWTAIAIAAFNSIFPIIAKLLTSVERHSSEGLKQTSLYFKIAVFRWVNTAVIITIITPFTATLDYSDGLIPQIYAIFFAEIITTNGLQLLDPAGHFKRHFMAPRAVTQDKMNLAMQGAEVELAERYTNMTKMLFLALWYSSIFPGALFLCSFALLVNYIADGFSLMRTWKRLPQLGARISRFSRRYFFSTAIVAMAVVSGYYWSGFPFDNLCKNDDAISKEYLGNHTIKTSDGTMIQQNIDSDTESFRYCHQDLLRYTTLSFPALSRWQSEDWMSDDQETVVNIYGWTSLVVLVIVLGFFIILIVKNCQERFSIGHEPCGKDMNIPFSQVRSISAFVPQVDSTVYSYPLLACDVQGIDPDLFDWTDPDRPHSYYDLTQDACELIGEESVSDKKVFSILSHMPPAAMKKVGE